MGLDVTHGCWSGSYRGFHLWRSYLIDAAGYIDLDRLCEQHNLSEDECQGYWDKIPDDPLLIILLHSDCGGIIKKDHCLPLAAELENIMEKPAFAGKYKSITSDFIEGLRQAHKDGEDVEFT